jgi:hypothetical protein
MSTPNEENNPILDDVIEPTEDALPAPARTGHGKMPESIDDEDFQNAAEQERAAAGLTDYAPSDVPPATDPLPPEASDEADRAQRGLTEEESGE